MKNDIGITETPHLRNIQYYWNKICLFNHKTLSLNNPTFETKPKSMGRLFDTYLRSLLLLNCPSVLLLFCMPLTVEAAGIPKCITSRLLQKRTENKAIFLQKSAAAYVSRPAIWLVNHRSTCWHVCCWNDFLTYLGNCYSTNVIYYVTLQGLTFGSG